MTAAQLEARVAMAELHRGGGWLQLVGDKVFVAWRGGHALRDAALAERLRAAKDELRPMLRPFASATEFAAAAERTFGGEGAVIFQDPLPGDNSGVLDNIDSSGWTLRQRLAGIEPVLNQPGPNGRGRATRSLIKSCLIGLKGFAGEHPAVDLMLARLAARLNPKATRRS